MPSGMLGTYRTNRTSTVLTVPVQIISSLLPACGLAFLVLGDPSCVEVFRLRFCLPVHGFLDGGA